MPDFREADVWLRPDRDLIDVLQALLTPAIAIAAVAIGVLQWRLAQAKLRHDLYDRRIAVYESTQAFISQSLVGLKDADVIAFERVVASARYLFTPSMEESLREILGAGVDLRRSRGDANLVEPGDARQKVIDQYRDTTFWLVGRQLAIKEDFDPYLIVEPEVPGSIRKAADD